MNFEGEFNMPALEQVIQWMYGPGNNPQQVAAASEVLTNFKAHPHAWQRCHTILERAARPESKASTPPFFILHHGVGCDLLIVTSSLRGAISFGKLTLTLYRLVFLSSRFALAVFITTVVLCAANLERGHQNQVTSFAGRANCRDEAICH